MKEVFNPQPSEQNPVIVENYPYGFTQKTKAKYYVETTKNGQRVVFQTLNPKTQQWNNPKKSVYSDIFILYRNTDNDHVESDGFSSVYTDEKDLNNFLTEHPESTLTDYQWKQILIALAIYKARKHMTYTIVPNPTPEEEARIKQHEDEAQKIIPSIVKHYYVEEREKPRVRVASDLAAEVVATILTKKE